MAERSAKRQKLLQRDDDDYGPGNITEIELHNFMTFDHVKSKPGPRLNIVIGPNGTGKSSLVCAIALGLGGEPQLLGRASSIGAYVKRGEESGFIKISLRSENPGEHFTIMRKIHTNNKSEWLFNGKVVSKKDVVEITQRFNIQVDNLTQFLPQDRVCEFAKLTPVQLLKETEKAVGDPQLPIRHRTLVDKSGELKRLEVTVKQNGGTLNQLKALNSELEKDVERVRQREELLEKVKMMNKKLPWLKYDIIQKDYLDAKKREADAKKLVDEAAKILNTLQEPINKQKKTKAMQEAAFKKVSNLIAESSRKRMEILENEVHLEVQVQGKYKQMEDLRKLEESRQERISRAREELAAAELEFASMPIYETPEHDIKRLAAQILEMESSVKQKLSQKSEKEKILDQKKITLNHWRERLKDMENAKYKLLQALRQSGADKISEAYQWVQEHRREFNKEVYGPVLLEVNIPERNHAPYLEHHVPYYIWKSFITQDAADRDFLVKNMKSFDVPVLNYVAERGSAKLPFEVSVEMHSLGIYSRLDQVFHAPDAVRDVLISQSALEHSYIGSKETDRRADRVPGLDIFDLWTPENHYRWTTSRYDGHISASVDSVSSSRLFLCNLDAGEIEKLRGNIRELEDTISHLQESFRTLQTEGRVLEDEAAKLHRQREDIVKTVHLEKKKRREMENRINQRRMKLTSIDNEDDLDGDMKKLTDQAAKFNIQRFDLAIEIKNMLTEAVAYKWSFAEKQMTTIELEAKIRGMEQSLKNQEKVVLSASHTFENCKKDTEAHREQLSSAKRYAESIAIITPELEQEFLQMPKTIEELEAAIQDNVSQANAILFLNHNILEEYENRQRKIKDLEIKLEADNNELRRCSAEIETLKGSWLPTLRNLISQINQTFGRNFQEMAVAGEVSLDEHDMDFDKFGILIKVKFRQAGQLQALSAHHQSGGERSVSTILYLVSLQDLTSCPFRVVDEINQGMDPINERKMFQQLVRAASQLNTPQCFLLTPKLLPDLEYSEACTILTIYNAPWIGQAAAAWSEGDNWGTVMGLI